MANGMKAGFHQQFVSLRNGYKLCIGPKIMRDGGGLQVEKKQANRMIRSFPGRRTGHGTLQFKSLIMKNKSHLSSVASSECFSYKRVWAGKFSGTVDDERKTQTKLSPKANEVLHHFFWRFASLVHLWPALATESSLGLPRPVIRPLLEATETRLDPGREIRANPGYSCHSLPR
jgi:hypothetical protein